LERFAEAGPLRPEIAFDARVLVEPPYLILYRVVPDGVQIVRVLHGARHVDITLFKAGLD
jgi:toxin ParE1/3/4